MQKELAVPVYLKNGKAVCGPDSLVPFESGNAAELAEHAGNSGADAILLFDLSEGDQEHEEAIGIIKEAARAVDIPIYAGGNIHRMEDVKKLLYAGCQKVFLNYAKQANIDLTYEVSSKFGKEKILACVRTESELSEALKQKDLLGGAVAYSGSQLAGLLSDQEAELAFLVRENAKQDGEIADILKSRAVFGLASEAFRASDFDFMEQKHRLKDAGLLVNTYESSVSWDELKKNSDGMVPVVVQDYKTEEVLMVAYMNQEAFEATIRSGKMTYWSRSRQELWLKGLTSGHFQYLKELLIDCDNDTLLAKVQQIGAACHTGNKSCFYRSVMKREYDGTNPMKVFEDVFAVIEDRKIHPKEGSYTNYLFDKGIDKILKKVGEEATEIVIAAKNPDPEEIKYEISDFLYHVMVLMAERGVTWEDITKELARR